MVGNNVLNFFELIKGDQFFYVLSLIVMAISISLVDLFFGWSNARFNKNVVFVSGLAIYGIMKKMNNFILIVIFVFLTMLILPTIVAIPLIIAFLIAYIFSELNSVLSHLGLTEDGKTGEVFIDFFKRLMSKGDEEK